MVCARWRCSQIVGRGRALSNHVRGMSHNMSVGLLGDEPIPAPAFARPDAAAAAAAPPPMSPADDSSAARARPAAAEGEVEGLRSRLRGVVGRLAATQEELVAVLGEGAL